MSKCEGGGGGAAHRHVYNPFFRRHRRLGELLAARRRQMPVQRDARRRLLRSLRRRLHKFDGRLHRVRVQLERLARQRMRRRKRAVPLPRQLQRRKLRSLRHRLPLVSRVRRFALDGLVCVARKSAAFSLQLRCYGHRKLDVRRERPMFVSIGVRRRLQTQIKIWSGV